MSELQCFCLAGEDHVIARSIEDALELWAEMTGETWEATIGEPLGDDWEVEPLGKTLAISFDGDAAVTRTIGEWIQRLGRGLLCSRNW